MDLREREKKVDHILKNDHLPDKVTIRVGDRLFYTTSTILISTEKENYFHGLFTSKFKKPEDGIYFLARDPKCFEYVLEFLTYGSLVSEIGDRNLLKKLAIDADFYLLPELKEQAQKQLDSIPNLIPNLKDQTQCVVAKFQNGSCSGSGAYWSWNSTVLINNQYFQLRTQNYNNDTVTVLRKGTYLISIRVGVQTQANTYSSLYINGSDVARSYISCGNAHYYQSPQIIEVFPLNANDKLQVYSSYTSGPLNNNPHNSFCIYLLSE